MTAQTAEAWTADDSTFGARLALVRQRMGWGNVKEAALACGLPVETWRTWERDNVKPRNYTEVCDRIAEHTRCDLGWLLNADPTGSPFRRPRLDTNPWTSAYKSHDSRVRMLRVAKQAA